MAVAGDPGSRKGIVVAKNELAKKAGVKTTDTVYQAQRKCPGMDCVEYTNFSGGTWWSDLRRKNGHAKPYSVKTWCLGNEMDGPWQIGSRERDPRGYGVLAHEASKAMKWIDPNIETMTVSPAR